MGRPDLWAPADVCACTHPADFVYNGVSRTPAHLYKAGATSRRFAGTFEAYVGHQAPRIAIA